MRVKPNARSCGLQQMSDGTWVARVKSPPLEGKANDELVRLIAQHFGVSRTRVSIRTGTSSRVKLVQIEE